MRVSFLHLTAPAFLVGASLFAAESKIDFQRDIRPIISDRCYKCHGPDEDKRKAKLRLDVREDALKPAKSGDRAIVPGKVDESELVKRIFSTDDSDIMPPPEMKKPLSEEQKRLFKQWIAEGADYQPHWAYLKPQAPAVPQVKHHDAVRNPIDAFVIAKLEAAGFAPSPQADAATLARRVALDLTGLPPSQEQLAAFVKSPTHEAYEALVDSLIASKHYGERWARRWLDLARYADTNGYEKDRYRSIWPYRDWVINAINADMPFDQFSIEQLAGDMLPNATPQQLIATGFHRNTMLNEEGGIDPNEFRFNAMVDRVSTTGTTWLGLTMQCVQCHTHKYDPILHTEYYGMMAFLNNADEPDYDLPDANAEQQYQANLQQAQAMLAKLPEQFPGGREAAEKAFARSLTELRAKATSWTTLTPLEAKTNMPLLTVQPDGSLLGSGDITKSDTYNLVLKSDGVKAITAVRLEALPHDSLPAHGPGMCYYEGPKGDFFMGEFHITANGQPVKIASATQSYAKNNFGKNDATAMLATDGDPQTGWSCAARYGERHEAVFVFDKPVTADKIEVKMMFGRHYACPLGHFRISAATQPKPVASPLDNDLQKLLLFSDAQLGKDERAKLFEHFLITAPQLAKQSAKIKSLQKKPGATTSLVMRERPASNPRPTFRHHRGEFTQPKEQVEPVTISFLHPFPKDQPKNRLNFAKWLMSPDNPLTPRVVMNREWAALFGTGILKTVQDFGYQSEPPSNQPLLDFLATEFIKQKWSMKAMHKLMVMSGTYRQSAAKVAKAPDALLASFPRTRLDAEIIRDSMLSASGLLNDKVGGPSVYPPQPDSVTEVAYGKFQWTPSTGADRYRRSLYTFMKRTAPFAMFTTFDAPTGEQCLCARETSNSPMQALTTMNDVVATEAAQATGKLIASVAGNDDQRLDQLYLRTLARTPDNEERALMQRFLTAQRARLQVKELDAAKITGDAKASLDAALWTLVARTVFNLDEFVTKG